MNRMHNRMTGFVFCLSILLDERVFFFFFFLEQVVIRYPLHWLNIQVMILLNGDYLKFICI